MSDNMTDGGNPFNVGNGDATPTPTPQPATGESNPFQTSPAPQTPPENTTPDQPAVETPPVETPAEGTGAPQQDTQPTPNFDQGVHMQNQSNSQPGTPTFGNPQSGGQPQGGAPGFGQNTSPIQNPFGNTDAGGAPAGGAPAFGAPQGGQPQGGNPSFGTPQGQPQGMPQGQPQGMPQGQPQGGNFAGGAPAFQPQGGAPAFQPQGGGQPSFGNHQGGGGGGQQVKYNIIDMYWYINSKIMQQQQVQNGEAAILTIGYNASFNNLRFSFHAADNNPFSASSITISNASRLATANIFAEHAVQLLATKGTGVQVHAFERVIKPGNWTPNQTSVTWNADHVLVQTTDNNNNTYTFPLVADQILGFEKALEFMVNGPAWMAAMMSTIAR